MNWKKLLLISMLLLLNCVNPTSRASAEIALGTNTLEMVTDSVFEVVVPKPTVDSVSYKDPLPFDILPYSIRNDKYYSIGSAFAIGPNEFVSAAHVMNLGAETQYQGPCLRDKDGN